MALTSRFAESMLANLLETDQVEAVLIDADGNRSTGVIEVARIREGENQGEPVEIDPPKPVAAVEFDGRRFEFRPNLPGRGLWEESPRP